MKQLLVAVLAFFISLNVMADDWLKSGSFAPLNNVNKVNFEVEFVSIHGMSESDFGNYETDWFKDKPEVTGMILDNANSKLRGMLSLGICPTADYTVRVVAKEISRKGNYNCDVEVLDSAKQVIAKISGLYATGGTWGTKLNLIKDGARSIGKKIGSILKSEIKKAKQ